MLDVTTLMTYLYCPRKLFLEHVLCLEKPFKPELLLGTIKHALVSKIVDALPELVIQVTNMMVVSQISDMLRIRYQHLQETVLQQYAVDLKAYTIDASKLCEELAAIIELQVSFFTELIQENIEHHHCYERSLWEKFNPKFRTEVYLASKELQLKGKIDVLMQLPDLAVPIELKFSRTAALYEGHHIQLGAYIMLLQHAGYPSGYGTIYFPLLNSKENIALNPFLKYDIQRLIGLVHQLLIENSLPSYCNNKLKCNTCEYRIRCYDEAFIGEKLIQLRNRKI